MPHQNDSRVTLTFLLADVFRTLFNAYMVHIELQDIHVGLYNDKDFPSSETDHSDDTCEHMESSVQVPVVLLISYLTNWFGYFMKSPLLYQACVDMVCTSLNVPFITMKNRSQAHHNQRKSIDITVNFVQSYPLISEYASQEVHGTLNISVQSFEHMRRYVVQSASSQIPSLLLS
jgi:hypothetical protein